MNIDFNTIILLVVALLNAYVAYLSSRTDKNMGLLEKATNSMKDALVASTAKASMAEGRAAGVLTGTAAGLAQARREALQKVQEGPDAYEITKKDEP